MPTPWLHDLELNTQRSKECPLAQPKLEKPIDGFALDSFNYLVGIATGSLTELGIGRFGGPELEKVSGR